MCCQITGTISPLDRRIGAALAVDAMVELVGPIATMTRFNNGVAGATIECAPLLAHKETIHILFDRLTVHNLFLLYLLNCSKLLRYSHMEATAALASSDSLTWPLSMFSNSV
jgi:hypothetical protein